MLLETPVLLLFLALAIIIIAVGALRWSYNYFTNQRAKKRYFAADARLHQVKNLIKQRQKEYLETLKNLPK